MVHAGNCRHFLQFLAVFCFFPRKFQSLGAQFFAVFLQFSLFPGRNYIRPPPPPPICWPKGILQGRGVGVYILWPHAAGIFHAPPPLIHPPPLEGYFQGWGVGVYKICPRIFPARAIKRVPLSALLVWRTLANPQCHVHDDLPEIHQSSGEGAPHAPMFR